MGLQFAIVSIVAGLAAVFVARQVLAQLRPSEEPRRSCDGCRGCSVEQIGLTRERVRDCVQ